MPKEEQQRYYNLAKEDREQHMQRYPGWSARENYAINKKKKRKRDKSIGILTFFSSLKIYSIMSSLF